MNPLRHLLVTKLKAPENPKKSIVNLSIGEPSAENGYVLPKEVNEALIKVIQNGKHNGYTQHWGSPEARKAIVDK